MSYILLEYQCTCGARLESLESRSAPSRSLLHPSCGGRAERCISAVRGRVKLGEVTQGKSDPPPPWVRSTAAIGDGQSISAWRQEHRAAEAKQRYMTAKETLYG